MATLYHINGKVQWNSTGNAFHDNGKKAFNYTSNSVMHSNGRIAYKNSAAYHENGKIAYNSSGNAYYNNGKIAYRALTGTAYHFNGRIAYNSTLNRYYDMKGLPLATTSFLISIGIGIWLRLHDGELKLKVYDKTVANL